jgi:hypothetical protein
MKKTSIQWGILLALAISSISVAWVLADNYKIPLFNSPVSPYWEQTQITPTPQPQPVILPNVTAGPATLTTGLRGFWQLNEADAGIRADSSPVGSNALTNIGGVNWATGRIGNASDFENSAGTTQYLKIESGEAVGLNFDYSFTLVGWLKRESVPNSDVTLAAKFAYGTGINDRAYRLQFTNNNNLRLIVSPDGSYSSDYSVTGGASLTSTTSWYHVAGVFDAGAQRLKLYVNGNLDADKVVTYNTVFNSTAPFMLGASLLDGAAAHGFDGLLDEWRIYNRALSQSEIQALLNQ